MRSTNSNDSIVVHFTDGSFVDVPIDTEYNSEEYFFNIVDEFEKDKLFIIDPNHAFNPDCIKYLSLRLI